MARLTTVGLIIMTFLGMTMKNYLTRIIKVSIHLIVIMILTILTQVGGIIYLVSLLIARLKKLSRDKLALVFSALYLIMTLIVAPSVAPLFGRTALPLFGELKPLNIVTCLLNRHYVNLELKVQMKKIASEMNEAFPNTQTHYLDANFPFVDGFPLFPHLSHNDGKKLDLAFYYKDKNGEHVNNAPSAFGYGIYEKPNPGEVNTPLVCTQKGYWQYGLLGKFTPKLNSELQIDQERTRTLIALLVRDNPTQKIFIEPHLKTRWGFSKVDKVRFHGCQAVRHDDHIHTQIK